MKLPQVTIVGAGLIGGSIALAARKLGLTGRLVAIDAQPEPSQDHPFDLWVNNTDVAAVGAALADTTLTFLCVPVSAIITVLPDVLAQSSGIVTDCGSTKVALLSSIDKSEHRGRFVAGHPMAGRPQGGFENADGSLFQGRKWIVCPEGSDEAAVALVQEFVTHLGARVVALPAHEHDRSVAVTSHVPQVLASALTVYAVENDARRAAGPGFDSTTRVAGGAESMWRDIFETNAPAIGRSLADLGERITTMGRQLEAGDTSGVLATLEKARRLRDGAG